MSFLSILKAIGHVATVGIGDAAKVAPILSVIPGIGPIAATVIQSIVAVEGLISPAGTGAQKKAVVTQIIAAVDPTIPAATISEVIDGIVAGFNLLQSSLAKLPAAPATAAATTLGAPVAQ